MRVCEVATISARGGAPSDRTTRIRWSLWKGDDSAPPVDRPNLSKDYLAGSAPEEWVPLRPESFYADEKIDLKLATNVASIDARGLSAEPWVALDAELQEGGTDAAGRETVGV